MLDTAVATKLPRIQSNRVKKPAYKVVNKKFKVVSMFSGCGGMDLGFRGDFEYLGQTYNRLPFEIVWANDFSKEACRTYAKNIDQKIRCGDVWDMLDTLPSSTDVLIGGFPCQDISINGKGAGIKGKRSGLYRAMVEAIRRTKPRIFVAENVKGLLMKHNADSLKKVIADFESLGYRVEYRLFNAAHFGVPQSRERVIIVGVQDNAKKFNFPQPTHTPLNWLTAKDALEDLENHPEDAAKSHIWSRANVSSDQGNRKLKGDKPAHTIRAECHGNIQFHYRLPRRISMREAARIQSFPDDFMFESKLRETERQIGNAVPPVLAWHVAQSILKALQAQELLSENN